MTDPSPRAAPPRQSPLPFAEFVALVASCMALIALGIDTMLPALPAIGEALHVTRGNDRQYVITAFVTGFGVAQLVHGPLVDRFGRRSVMLVALGAYVVANLLCAVAASFALLLAARLVGGMVVAAVRVAIIATVRDCFAGRPMAQVMSIAFTVFMIVPVLAPAIGQAILAVAGWRAIFWLIAGIALLVLGWVAWRLPETLALGNRDPLSLRRLLASWRMVVGERLSLGYTLAAAALTGALYGYLNTVEQLMAQVFGRPRLLGAVFAACAITMAAANIVNARLVLRLGTRRLGHGALVGVAVVAAVHLLLIRIGAETLPVFIVLQAITLGCFGLSSSNFSAMAMERMGHMAGIASSVQGFTSITLGAMVGALIGQAFDGTPVPLVGGFLAAALVGLAIVAATERGRLFQPT